MAVPENCGMEHGRNLSQADISTKEAGVKATFMVACYGTPFGPGPDRNATVDGNHLLSPFADFPRNCRGRAQGRCTPLIINRAGKEKAGADLEISGLSNAPFQGCSVIVAGLRVENQGSHRAAA